MAKEYKTALLGAKNIATLGKHSNLDAFYGPYISLTEARTKVKSQYRDLGLTVGILEYSLNSDGKYIYREGSYYEEESPEEEGLRYSVDITEYWWRKGTTDDDLVRKIEKSEPTINANINSFYSINPGDLFNDIHVEYSGGLRGQVNIYRNNSLIDSLPLNVGDNVIRLGQYSNYNEYNFTLNFSDIGGNPATVYNNSELLESNEISFRLSIGTIIISDEFETYVSNKIINQTGPNSIISFPIKATYINSSISLYTVLATLDNNTPLQTLTGISGTTLLLSYNLGNILDLTIGSHTLLLAIQDINHVYEVFTREYSFNIVDRNTRGLYVEVLNQGEIYSGRNLVLGIRLISGEEVSNVRLSYSYNEEHWTDFNSTINLGETKRYSIIAPETTYPEGESFTVYVRWEQANCQTSLNFNVKPYIIEVSTNSLEYNFDAVGNISNEASQNYQWINTGTNNINNIEINSINAVSNGFSNDTLTLDGNFGVLKDNLFKNVLNVDAGFTLELKYNTKCIGNLDALVLKNEAILVSYDKVNIKLGNNISQSTPLSEDRWIHLTWVVDYDINDTNVSDIEDYLDFPASNIYINGSLCSSVTLGNKASNVINDILPTLRNLESAGTYLNCGSSYTLTENDYILLAQAYNILEKQGNNFYYNLINLGSSVTDILNNLRSRELFKEVKLKVDIILNSKSIGVADIKLFRFYRRPLKASEVYVNYKSGLNQEEINDNQVPIVVFTTFENENAKRIVDDLNNKAVLGYNDDGSKKLYADPLHFSDLLKMGQGEKAKQKTHFVYGRLLYYENGFNEEPTKEFYTMTSTQGTSSLLYPVKNFKTTLCKFDTENGVYQTKLSNGIYKLSKTKDNFGMSDWNLESKFTLKCDYMESAHFNNTPTCSFYNDIIDAENKFYEEDENTGTLVNKYNHNIEITNNNKYIFDLESKSPARKNGKFDAIKGFPCVVYALDADPINSDVRSYCTNDTYLGTYMFNLDKSASSLGFEINDENIVDKYDPFPVGGVSIALRFTYEIDGQKHLFLAIDNMSTFDINKCVDITNEIITQSYEGKANVRYSSGTFYSHSLYANFGYREYLLNTINIYNSVTSSNNKINISEAESGLDPLDFYQLPLIITFLETYLGVNSIQNQNPEQSSNPVYYIESRDEVYTLDISDSTKTYIPVYLNNLKKWQNEDSENSYYKSDYEDRWDYLLELDSLADKFKNSNGKIDWRHTWGDGITWGWRRAVNWIGEQFSLNPGAEKANFEKYFNKKYCILYYLQMMVFGLVDNAGKNCMWDTWDGLVWYPRPYDLDSATGLNNSGLEDVPTYAEIAKELSPIAISDNRGGVFQNIDTTSSRYKKYTTTTSKLWNTFGKVFNDEISLEYKKLRDSGIYNLDTILNYYTELTSKKISPDYYNKDMVIKYIYNYKGNSDYYTRIHGNRIESFYLWMKGRLVFCDSLYGYDSIKAINLRQSASATNTTLSFEVYYPQYIHVSIGTGLQIINLFCSPDSYFEIDGVRKNGSAFTTSVIATDKETDIYGGPNIKRINGVLSQLDSLTFTNAEKLVELDVSNSINLKSLTLDNCKYLQKLNASNCTRLNTTDSAINLSNSKYLKEVNFSGCTCKLLEGKDFSSVTFPENNNLLIINFENSAVRSISLSNSLNIETFNINGCNDLENLQLINCNIEQLNLLGYSLYTLILNGCNLLNTLNCNDTRYIRTLNISNCNALENVSFNGSSSPVLESINLTGASNIKNLDFGSSGSLKKILLRPNVELTTFNVENAVSFNQLNYGDLFDDENIYVDCSYLSGVLLLSFAGCSSITHIKNLGTSNSYYVKKVVGSTNKAIFSGCINLIELSDCYIKIEGIGGNSMFSGDQRLAAFTRCSFNLDECTSLASTFYNCDSLSWSAIKSNFMDKLNDVSENFDISLSSTFSAKNSVELSLPNGFFGKCKNVNNMDGIFSNPTYISLSGQSQKSINSITKDHFKNSNNEIIVLNKVKSLSSSFISSPNLSLIDDDLITTVFPNIEYLNGTFASCERLKIPDVSIFFKGLTSLKYALGTFYNCGSNNSVQESSYTFTLQNNGFKTCTNLIKISDVFRSCPKLNLTISTTIIPNSVVASENTFLGVKSLTFDNNLNDDIFEESNSKKNVYVGGMFGNCGLTDIYSNLFNNINPISNVRNEIDVLEYYDSSNRKLNYSYSSSRPNADYGVFLNNLDLTVSLSNILSLFQRLGNSPSCSSFYKLFKDCSSLLIDDLDLSSYTNIRNLSYLFEGCHNLNLLTLNIPSTVTNINYLLSEAKIDGLTSMSVTNIIKNKPSLTTAVGVFKGRNGYFDDSLQYELTGEEFENDILLLNVSYLFSRTKLYGTSIPAKLFDYCRRSLTNVSNLFSYCTYLGFSENDVNGIYQQDPITDATFKSIEQTIQDDAKYIQNDYEVVLGYRLVNDVKGLLSDCMELTDTSYMFSQCYNLGGKLPSTIFAINNKDVYYLASDEEVINGTAQIGDFKERTNYKFSKLTNMKGMFYNTNFNNYYTDNDNNRLLINRDTFINIEGSNSGLDISGMFAGLGPRYVGNIGSINCKCINGQEGQYKTPLKFIINFELFPNARKITKMDHLFFNSGVLSADGAFLSLLLISSVQDISSIFESSALTSLQTNFMISNISNFNTSLRTVNKAFYNCSVLASNENATIPNFGSLNYSKATTKNSNCYILTSGMERVGNSVSNIASSNVISVLIDTNNINAWSKVGSVGYSGSSIYPITY